ncbi:MAG: TfoX/Sxy family protein [Anaerolineaceae bacterium]|nr:MAG: TfoX/Sxy family protein [Anaerolineaceae bacterium]
MAYDEGLAQRVRDIMIDEPGLVEKKMFGGVGFMLDGNMACGVNKEDLIVRVGPENYDQAVIQPHTRPFDITGRPMKGWVMVAPAGVTADEDLQAWVNRGINFARTLPPK